MLCLGGKIAALLTACGGATFFPFDLVDQSLAHVPAGPWDTLMMCRSIPTVMTIV
jgi:hypothetical protein